jgi:hypothetical protein
MNSSSSEKVEMPSEGHTITINDLPSPLFVRQASKIPCFAITEAAHFLAKCDDDIPRLRNQLKGAAQRGLIHPRQHEGAGQNSPAYFGIDDLAAGLVLFALFDIGLADADMANYASLACYAWDRTVNPRPSYVPKGVSPVAAAMIGADRGQFWAFRLGTYHDDQTDARRVIAAVYDMDAPPADASQYLPPSMLPRVRVTVALPPLLLPLNRAFDRTQRH